MKIFNHVVTFHRPELQKQSFPGDKERALATMPAARKPQPRTKPPIEVAPLTPYNRLPSIAAVNAAIDARPDVRSPAEIVDCVRRRIQGHVRDHGRMPDWIILGDVHRQPAGQMMVMAALHEFRNFNGPKTFSFETTPTSKDLAERWLDARPNLLSHCLNRDIDIPFPGIQPRHTRLFTACMLAKAHGFQLHGFDLFKTTATSLEQREAAMVAGVVNRYTPQGVHIIFTGNAHVAKLHEQLSPPRGTSLAIAMLPKLVHPGEHEARNRLSYLLSTPGIETIKAHDSLRDGRLNATQFIKRELAPWHPPAAVRQRATGATPTP